MNPIEQIWWPKKSGSTADVRKERKAVSHRGSLPKKGRAAVTWVPGQKLTKVLFKNLLKVMLNVVVRAHVLLSGDKSCVAPAKPDHQQQAPST